MNFPPKCRGIPYLGKGEIYRIYKHTIAINSHNAVIYTVDLRPRGQRQNPKQGAVLCSFFHLTVTWWQMQKNNSNLLRKGRVVYEIKPALTSINHYQRIKQRQVLHSTSCILNVSNHVLLHHFLFEACYPSTS